MKWKSIKNKIEKTFCSHEWRYWDFVGDLPDRKGVEIRLENKFRKCSKCKRKQKMITMPNNWGRFKDTKMIWSEDYPVVGKITKEMIREARLKKLLKDE